MSKDNYLDGLKDKLSAGQIDRRQFMTTAIAAGMTVAAATTFASSAEAATPKMGGTLRVGHGHGSTSDTLDPGLFTNGFQLSLSFGFNGYLTSVGTDGGVAPEIAESWESTPDAATWSIKIRKDAEFHNGKSVTAKDVIASINHHRGKDSTSSAKPLFAAITDVKADGASAVKVTLDGGNADFPFLMTDYHMVIAPAKDDGTIDWQSGIGSGAYKLDHYEPGVSAELSRYKNSWKKTYLDGAQLVTLIDPNARTAAIVSNDVDIVDRVDLKTASLLGRKSGITLVRTDGPQHYTFPMLCDATPFNNVDVRRGIKLSVNRQELVDKILFGYGSVGNDIPLSRNQQFFDADIPQHTYDPDKAKFYFKKAGVLGETFKLAAANAAFPGAIDAAVLIQNSAKKAGIDVQVDRVPNDGYWSDVWLKNPWSACYWGGRPTADMMFSTAYKGGAAWNDTHWKNDRFDALMLKARAELDESKRRSMYYEMQQILWDDGGALIPMFASYLAAANENVGMPEKRASNWDLDGDRWMDRWWHT